VLDREVYWAVQMVKQGKDSALDWILLNTKWLHQAWWSSENGSLPCDLWTMHRREDCIHNRFFPKDPPEDWKQHSALIWRRDISFQEEIEQKCVLMSFELRVEGPSLNNHFKPPSAVHLGLMAW